MTSRKKLYLILGITAVVLVLCGTNIFASYYTEQRKVIIKTAAKRHIANVISVNGYVEPARKQEISLDASQKVMQLFVAKDQNVKKGEQLIKLDNSDLVHNLNIEKLNLAADEKEYQSLLGPDSQDRQDLEYAVKQCELELAAAQSDYEDAAADFEQSSVMFKNGIISKGELDSASKLLKKAENTLNAKKLETEKARAALSSYGTDKQENLSKLKSQIEISRENIRSLESKLGADTTASIDGKVVRLDVEQEQYPGGESPQVIIYDLSKYIVNIEVRQGDAVYISKGQTVKVFIKGLAGVEYKGTVEEIEEIATKKSESENEPKVKVKVSINNPDEKLRIGYEVEVQIDLSMKTDAVVIDFEGLLQESDGTKYVYCVTDNIATRRVVKTGIETEFEVEILEGLIQGDKYVVNPPEKMQEKDSVKIWGLGYEFK